MAIHHNAVSVNHAGQRRTFGFDHAYWSVDAKDPGFAGQEQVNNDIGKPCLENMIKGYNFCVFAYGQTGAGKTHTLSASSKGDKQMGLIPYVLEGLFMQHRAKFKNDELRIWISFMEIYNEQIRDLLSPGRDTTDLKVRDHPEVGAYVPGLTEAPCSEISDVKSLLDFGTKKRVTAVTNMNAGSSRSHAVFTIRAQRLTGSKPAGNKKDDRKSLSSRVNLVDLAGSERIAKSGADGLRLREGCAINQSLTALGLVIKQLAEIQRDPGKRRRNSVDERTKAIPFRASKLTFLLRESLAGNSRTFMVGAVSPASISADETISTLRFASSVKRVKTVALQNVNKKQEAVASLQAEVARLAEMLANAGAQGAGDATVKTLHDDLEERERLLQEMTKSHGQQLAEAKLVQAKREEVLKEMGLTQQDLAQTIGIDKDVPYLLNMNEDPALAGKMMYFLPLRQPITIGANQDNKIVLQGLGMPDHLCEIENLEEGVVVRTCQQQETGHPGAKSMKARVCVNASAMKENEQRKLKHNDKLFLGRVSAVRLIVPEAVRSLGQAGSALPEREQDAELLRAVIPEDSRAWADLHLRLEDLRSRLGEESGAEVFQTLLEASNLVDEANEITAAVKEEKMKFEVELVWDIHRAGAATDIVVIRLMKAKELAENDEDKSPASQNSEQENVAVTYWTLLKFKARLDQMRDCFDEKQRHGRWSGSGDCLRDPWMETSIVELRQRLLAHVDAESKRRNASKATIPSLPVSPREKDKLVKAVSTHPGQVRFGSKASIFSAATPNSSNNQSSRELIKVKPQQTLGRRVAPKGIEMTGPTPGPKVPRAPSTSSTAKVPVVSEDPPRRLLRPDRLASFDMDDELDKVQDNVSSVNISNKNQTINGSFKAELSDSLKAQLRDKSEKEELYRLRIDYLQQQIDLYRTAGVQAAERSPRVCARARSSSPSHEPRTSEVSGISAAATTFFGPRPCVSTGAVRSMSAREARPFMAPPPEAVLTSVATSVAPVAPVHMVSARELWSPRGPGPMVSVATESARQHSVSPEKLERQQVVVREPLTNSPERGRDREAQLQPLAKVIYPTVGPVHNVQPILVPAVAPQVMVLRQGQAKEPLAVKASPIRAALPESRAGA